MQQESTQRAVVIGAGFAGLAAASTLAQSGFQVLVVDQHTQPGGRARTWESDGFTFDMGPSWYWMPDVFEQYFARFGKSPADYYDLVRLDPSYRVWFGDDSRVDVPASMDGLLALFESIEPGAAERLQDFLAEAAYKYEVGMGDLVYRPGRSIMEFVDWRVVKATFKLHLFKSFASYVRRYFKDQRLIQLLEFPILFLGAKPAQTPALYSLMNHADLKLGTWYPMGGMYKVVEGMVSVAQELGVELRLGAQVAAIETSGGRVRGVRLSSGEVLPADVVVGGADYHHVEQQLLAPAQRSYDESYWQGRTMAPSCLLFYIGVDRRVDGLLHHNLFFDADFDAHAQAIYDRPEWPDQPLFYVCCPSKTDPSVAPEGKENLFLLVPLAPGMTDDTPAQRERLYERVMDRLERHIGQAVRPHVVVKRSYAHSDFVQDYNAFKGNAYGLANTLRQTAILKPTIQSSKLPNLYYTGQLTVPGPGVPPSLISGQIVAAQIQKDFTKR